MLENQRYIRPQIVVEAFQWTGNPGDDNPEWVRDAYDDGRIRLEWKGDDFERYHLAFIEDYIIHYVKPGDWLILLPNGRVTKCNKDDFSNDYCPVQQPL